MSLLAGLVLLCALLFLTFVIGLWLGWDLAEHEHDRGLDRAARSELEALQASERLSAAAWTAQEELFEVAAEEEYRQPGHHQS